MTTPTTIPDAVAALVQAVLEANPACEPSRRGHLIVRELERQGWEIRAPEGRGGPPPPGRS